MKQESASGLPIERGAYDRVIALAGNPNVGKSTLFNALTGLKQHTGNWPGKTVSSAVGVCRRQERSYAFIDLPGTYSLFSHSPEEVVAEEFLSSRAADAVIVVCDATNPERNFNLLFQILELHQRVLLCLNLSDEAERKGVVIDTALLRTLLGIPVLCTDGRKRHSADAILSALEDLFCADAPPREPPVRYAEPIEAAIESLSRALTPLSPDGAPVRRMALGLLLGKECDGALGDQLCQEKERLLACGIGSKELEESIVGTLFARAEALAARTVRISERRDRLDRRIDRIVTGRYVAYPIMLCFLALILFLTISFANYPSALLSSALFWLGDRLSALLVWLGVPTLLHDGIVYGLYRVPAWVISVMLPPMAIFFPLFTILEDLGYLPRIAYNLDRPFARCHACGKQALTMCMGFGCNAAGVVGCRIIDSPRERLLAILTNSLVPCNGRFPILITLLTLFFFGTGEGILASVFSALGLSALILLSIFATFGMTRLLSATVLRGMPSSFVLELPPYRRPQVGRVIVRSLFDRTLRVLGRAVAVAAPAGVLLWGLANVAVGGHSLLAHCAAFLDPFGHLLGMDGAILLAFLLALPANEIVLPIVLMIYLCNGTLTDFENVLALREILISNGWSALTACCVLLFSLFHWPCSTTILTIKKETGSWRLTALAVLLPTVLGILLCAAVAATVRLFA